MSQLERKGAAVVVKVSLVVEGFDILSDAMEELPEALISASWRIQDGLTLATLYVNSDPVSAACTFTRVLENSGLGRVVRVNEDFVNISDIASRLSVGRETVRTWTTGKRGSGNFPSPHHLHSGGGEKGAMKVWRWREVNSWLSRLTLDDGYEYPSDAQIAEINAHLHRLPEPVSSEWQDASRGHIVEHHILDLISPSPFVDIEILLAKRVGFAKTVSAAKESNYRILRGPSHPKTYT